MAKLTIADLEIERNDEPFSIEMDDGEVFDLRDPKRLPAKVLAVLERLPVSDQLRHIIGEKSGEFLDRDDVDGYFFEKLMQQYRAHFGLGTAPEANASQR